MKKIESNYEYYEEWYKHDSNGNCIYIKIL